MTSGDWALIISLAVPVLIFLGRSWLSAWISSGVQHQFNVKVEALKADLRASEERLKSDLRDKETEISALRQSVLAGSATRQNLLDKRQFDAVERVWKAVNDLGQFQWLSSFMAILKYDAIAKVNQDPEIQHFLSMMGGKADFTKFVNVGRDEEPYLPPLAWAYFSAYIAILAAAYSRFTILQAGIENPQKLLNTEGLKKILKTTLPQYSDYIDANEPGAYHYLLEHIQRLLLAELRKVLEGTDADQAATARAKAITDAINEAQKNNMTSN